MTAPNAAAAQKRAAIADRRRKVAQLYLRRMEQKEIARHLNVSKGTISKDVAAIIEEWRAEAVEDVGAAKLRDLAELDTIENEASVAFNTQKDAAFLRVRLDAKKRRAEMLGYDAPKSTAITSMPKVLVEYVNSWKDVPRG